MGNYILDFVDKELLAHRKRKEKVNQQECSYILQETIKKQEEINKGIQNNKNTVEQEKETTESLKTKHSEIKTVETKQEQSISNKEKDTEKEEREEDIIGEKKPQAKVIMTTMMNSHSLEELAGEKEIPPQQKDKNSIVSKEIIDILEWNNVEQSILSFNEEEEDMNISGSKTKKLKEITKEKTRPKKKNKMKTILFQAIVGLILIIISVFYLVDSPAEQKVLESGMSIWIDKIKVLLWNSNEYLHDKFLTDLDEDRKNLLLDINNSLEKVNNCNLSWDDLKNDIQQLKNFRDFINSMNLEKFKTNHMMIETQIRGIINGDVIKKCY